MKSLYDLPTPALLLDLDVLERNLRRMADRARELDVQLRPHIKTHKCVEIGMAQRELGAAGITVSTLHEGAVFAEHGFDDVTWAFPLIPGRAAEAAGLAQRVRLGVVVDSADALEVLERTEAPIHVWLKIDCGYHRAGLAPEASLVVELAQRIRGAGDLRFAGLLSHSGNAYDGRSPGDIRRIAEQERRIMASTAGRLRDAGVEVPGVSVGSTPSMARVASLDGVTEVRPGNYALYDYTQVALGSCEVSDCAATVMASVVSSSPAAGTSVVDAGALALSLDAGPNVVPRGSYGEILDDYAAGSLRQNARLVSLSQEHGIVTAVLSIGAKVRILPNHSCLTVACFDAFSVVRGDRVLDGWRIWRGR
jgi:D-serine deaminase-like pyridoxal phosphate-dependent protein